MSEKETTRVEAFSDGVFAIAMTLLILEIRVPSASAGSPLDNWALLRSLLLLWPSYLAFLLSFGTVLVMWINHHGLFKHAHRANNRLLFANGFLLLVVTFIPFPTAVLAQFLNKPAANAAATFYCGSFVLVSICYNFLLTAVLANRLPDAVGAAEHEGALARVKRAYNLGLATYVLATIVAVFSAIAGVAICFSLWFLWVCLNYSPRSTRN
jgi:uncharacterized membrane protein